MVVGAGSAGCVVAGRLAGVAGNEVVLIEAGPAPAPDADPTLQSFFDALAQPGRSYPDLMATRVAGQRPARYQRGRGLGGSGAVNAMVSLHGGGYEAAHLLPEEPACPAELGAVDRALLAAAPDAIIAPLNRRDGRRVSTADAYLRSAPGADFGSGFPGRLDIVTETVVDYIEIATVGGAQPKAVGVVTATGDQIDADRVVVCAGAIHTPAILLRSRIDVPGIGEGLMDHPSAPITLGLVPEAQADPGSLVLGTCVPRDPIQVLPMNHLGSAAPGYGLLLGALMDVGSRGRVSLVDPDPLVHPRVEFNMLDDPADLAGMVRAVEAVLELLNHEAFTSIVSAAYIDEHGTTVAALRDRETIERWIQSHVGDYVHAASSCPMGVVVDSQCRVVGHEALMVCDASVFERIPEVNTHLPVVMLAETMVARWLQAG